MKYILDPRATSSKRAEGPHQTGRAPHAAGDRRRRTSRCACALRVAVAGFFPFRFFLFCFGFSLFFSCFFLFYLFLTSFFSGVLVMV